MLTRDRTRLCSEYASSANKDFFVRKESATIDVPLGAVGHTWVVTRLPNGRIVESVSRDVFDRAVRLAARKSD